MRQLSGWLEFDELIKKSSADVYGISISAVDYEYALKTILILKNNHSNIIAGGIHPTVFPEKYQSFGITVVQGEGEITFIELLKMLENNEKLPETIRGKKPVLDELPFVERSLFDYKNELNCAYTDQKTPVITMLAGRGCPYSCAFCQPAENVIFGSPYRIRSPENVIEELDVLKKRYGYRSVIFWDDTFTLNPEWIDNFCALYNKDPFIACSRADIICNNEDTIKKLADAGCCWLIIGFESGSQRLLDLIKKGTTVEENYKAAEICRKYGIKVFATYMFGLPTETKEESYATFKMIENINPEHKSPFIFTPIEGTTLYKYCDNADIILEEAKKRTIERTGLFNYSLKGINYEYIKQLLK